MRKLVSLLLSLLMLCSFAITEEASPTGTWYLNNILYSGVTVPSHYLGLDMIVTLNADGTSTTAVTGQAAAKGTWTLEDTQVTVVSDTMTDVYVYDGYALAAQAGDMTLLFDHTPNAPVVYGESPIVDTATANDFYGSWYCVAVETANGQIPPIFADMNIAMSIDAYDVACVNLYHEYNIGWVGNVASFENGQITVNLLEEDPPKSITLRMHENGILSYVDGEGNETVTYYFEHTIIVPEE